LVTDHRFETLENTRKILFADTWWNRHLKLLGSMSR
jgi:hypothetical protein